ncbi:hypothetical protein MNV49_004369 [Pseudohyphozyma bogoriensis]|nr:hypothetical protein MNV49_004369 [Pseudohyphozyma bogoriensis]
MNGLSEALQALEEMVPNKQEWRYEMRRECQETLPGLFVGPFQPSWQRETLRQLGITHILCIAESREQHLFRARFPEELAYLILEVRDADDQNLIRIFPQTAYVMCKADLTHEDAFLFVQGRRFCVAPRVEFQHQLEAYKPIFMASAAMSTDRGAQSAPRSNRRTREDDDDDDDDGGMGVDGGMAVDDDMRQRVPMPNWSRVGS